MVVHPLKYEIAIDRSEVISGVCDAVWNTSEQEINFINRFVIAQVTELQILVESGLLGCVGNGIIPPRPRAI